MSIDDGNRGNRGNRGYGGKRRKRKKTKLLFSFSSGGSVEAISLTAFSGGMSARDVSMYSSS